MTALAMIAFSTASSLFAEKLGPLEVKTGQTIEITRSHSWCWFPTIHKFREGSIMVGMVLCPDQLNAESTNSGYCLSLDGGKTWGPRHAMGQGANHDGAWSEVPDKDDAIWQWGSYPQQMKKDDRKTFDATLTKFLRGGRASSQDRDILLTLNEPAHFVPTMLFDYKFDGKNPVPDTSFTEQIAGRPWGNIIEGPEGEWLCTGYLITEADAKRMGDASSVKDEEANPPVRKKVFNRTILLRSTDNGKTWTEHGTIAAVPEGERPEWMGTEGPNEATINLLPDKRLYAVYRTGGIDGQIGHGWSSDGGKTWTPPAPIGFQGVAPRIHRLSNGMLALATGRPGPVQLRFNFDGNGEKWSEPVTLYTGRSTRYCDFLEVEPGKLLVVYDNVPYGWHPIPFSDRDARNKILGTFVEYTKSEP